MFKLRLEKIMNNFFKKYSYKSIKIERISDEWLEENCLSMKKSTYQKYSLVIKNHINNSVLSNTNIKNLESKNILVFSKELLKDGLSAKTVNDILLVLNQILKFSNDKYGVPNIKIQYVKEEKKEMRVLTNLEQNNLEIYLKNNLDIYSLAVFISLYTGLRVGELCALKWGDIRNQTICVDKTMIRLKDDTGKSMIMINSPKTENSNRTIPVPIFLSEMIEKHRKSDDKYVISTDKLDFVEPRLMQLKFKKITDICNLENVTFHTLRHTFATRCIECGFDVKTLSEILGHSNVKTTLNKYVHSSMQLKKNNMEKLSYIVA